MPNKIYQLAETAVTWLSTGGTEAFMVSAPLNATAGRQGAHHDFGTTAHSRTYAWRAFLKPGATRVVGQTIEIYLKTSDGTRHDNDDGTGDIAVSSVDKLRNLMLLGIMQIDENAAVEMVLSGEVDLAHRYAAPVFWNATANALSSTATDYGFHMTPIPLEVQ